jgi:hypothetical protein
MKKELIFLPSCYAFMAVVQLMLFFISKKIVNVDGERGVREKSVSTEQFAYGTDQLTTPAAIFTFGSLLLFKGKAQMGRRFRIALSNVRVSFFFKSLCKTKTENRAETKR